MALLAGALFGVGLALSDMTNPNVILGFLNPFGEFNPTLAYVLGGAVGTTLLTFRFVLKRSQPILSPAFQLPKADRGDSRLLIGAAIFGVGWGLVGYCPGPALVGAAAGAQSAVIFVLAMLVGSFAHRAISQYRRGRPSE